MIAEFPKPKAVPKRKGLKEDAKEKGRSKQYGPLYKKFKLPTFETGEKGLDGKFIIHLYIKFLNCNFFSEQNGRLLHPGA